MPADIYNLLMGSEPDAQESAQALANQIRRGRQSALMGTLADRKAPIAAYGAMQGQFQQQDQNAMEKAAQARMAQGEEAKNRAAQAALEKERIKGMFGLERARIAAERKNATDDKDERIANEKLRIALDPNGPRAGNLGNFSKRATVLGDVQRQLDLFKQNPTDQQAYELARTFDAAVSMGAATVSGTQHLLPQSAYGDIIKLKNWASNRNQPVNRAEWVKNMQEQVNSQTDYWKGEVDKIVRQRLGSFSPDLKKYKDSTALTLESMGLDPTTVPYHPFYKGSGTAGPPSSGGEIKVRMKSTGQTGTLPAAEFDPNLYEKI